MRALRDFETQPEDAPPRALTEILRDAVADFRPSAHTERLELMDLLAVKECTDSRFLPEKFKSMSLAQVNTRIAELKRATGE